MNDYISVSCPFCSAQPGQPCVSRHGTPLDYAHKRRQNQKLIRHYAPAPAQRQTLVSRVVGRVKDLVA